MIEMNSKFPELPLDDFGCWKISLNIIINSIGSNTFVLSLFPYCHVFLYVIGAHSGSASTKFATEQFLSLSLSDFDNSVYIISMSLEQS